MKRFLPLPPNNQVMPDGNGSATDVGPSQQICCPNSCPFSVNVVPFSSQTCLVVNHAIVFLSCHHWPVCQLQHLHTCHCTYCPPEVYYRCGLGSLHLSCCNCPHAFLGNNANGLFLKLSDHSAAVGVDKPDRPMQTMHIPVIPKYSHHPRRRLSHLDTVCLLQSKLLSDFAFPAPMQLRQPPRIIPPALLKDVRQVEFVGYVANPMYKRGAASGEATKAVAALRNMRHQPKQASLNAAANAARTRHALALPTFHVFLSMILVLPAARDLAFT